MRVGWQELELRRKVKAAGGKWDPENRVWMLCRERVLSLDLEDRIVEGALKMSVEVEARLYRWRWFGGVSTCRWFHMHVDSAIYM